MGPKACSTCGVGENGIERSSFIAQSVVCHTPQLIFWYTTKSAPKLEDGIVHFAKLWRDETHKEEPSKDLLTCLNKPEHKGFDQLEIGVHRTKEKGSSVHH